MKRTLFAALLLAGIACRIGLLTHYTWVDGGDVDVYLADEGVVGLMAKHILEGTSFPIFFYGQHYLGALEAYLAALSFAVFGMNLLTLRLVPFAVSLGLIGAVYVFTAKAYSRAAARWSTALVAISPMYFLQWNLKARGGFIEHVLLLFLILSLLWRYLFDGDRRPVVAFVLGLTIGIAFWVNQLVLAYMLVLVPILWFDRTRPHRWVRLAGGFILGASLLIGYNVVHPMATFRTLARKSVTMNRVPTAQRDEHWLLRGIEKRVEALSQGADKIGMVFGVPPRANVAHLGLSEDVRKGSRVTNIRQGLAFLPLLVFGAALLGFRPRRMHDEVGRRRWNWRGPDQVLFLFFAATIAVGYVSPRYMLPAYPLAAVMAGAWIGRRSGKSRAWMIVGLAAVTAYNLLSWADLGSAIGSNNRERVKALVEALDAHGLARCYSAGPMYHAVFESGERIILSPLQKDRYPAYGRLVNEADRICYVFRPDQKTKAQHRAFLQLLARKNITYRRLDTGAYIVWYKFHPRREIRKNDMDEVRRQSRRETTTHISITTSYWAYPSARSRS